MIPRPYYGFADFNGTDFLMSIVFVRHFQEYRINIQLL